MADTALWARRVADWRSSRENFNQHCKDKEFTSGALRYWAQRLGEAAPPSPPTVLAAPAVRMARVVRTRAPVVVAEAAPRPSNLVIELGGARISVGPGFDRATLTAVLQILAARGGAR